MIRSYTISLLYFLAMLSIFTIGCPANVEYTKGPPDQPNSSGNTNGIITEVPPPQAISSDSTEGIISGGENSANIDAQTNSSVSAHEDLVNEIGNSHNLANTALINGSADDRPADMVEKYNETLLRQRGVAIWFSMGISTLLALSGVLMIFIEYKSNTKGQMAIELGVLKISNATAGIIALCLSAWLIKSIATDTYNFIVNH
jgi:hypothetical protein